MDNESELFVGNGETWQETSGRKAVVVMSHVVEETPRLLAVDEVRVVEVALNKRYIVILYGVTEQEAESMVNAIYDWYDSDDKILVLGSRLPGSIKIVRVDEEADNGQ